MCIGSGQIDALQTYYQFQGQEDIVRSEITDAQQDFLQQQILAGQRQFQNFLQFEQAEFEERRKGLRERARLRVAAGEAGMSGSLTLRTMSAQIIQQGIREGSIRTSKELARAARLTHIGLSKERTHRRIERARESIPSDFEQGLAIGGSFFRGAARDAQMVAGFGLF